MVNTLYYYNHAYNRINVRAEIQLRWTIVAHAVNASSTLKTNNNSAYDHYDNYHNTRFNKLIHNIYNTQKSVKSIGNTA